LFSAAVREHHKAASDEEIGKAIAGCLINSRDRGEGRERRRHASAPQADVAAPLADAALDSPDRLEYDEIIQL
jgi:hypothetical protein